MTDTALPVDAPSKTSANVLVTSVRNEGPFLLEWIAYHRAIGFDRILVAHNDCSDGTDILLNALAGLGWVSVFDNPVTESVAPQIGAAHRFMRDGGIADGDWVMWLDADEYLNIHTGNGQVPDLRAALGEADAFLCNWRVFGDGDGQFKGRMLAEPFVRAAELSDDQSSRVKTFFRFGPHVERLDIHRPILDAEADYSAFNVISGKGRPWRSTAGRNSKWLAGKGSRTTSRAAENEIGWKLAQVNHYAVRDKNFFKLKMARGRGYKAAKRGNNRHGDDYWTEFNLNHAEDRSILRLQEATETLIAEALTHPAVAEACDHIARAVQDAFTKLDT